MIAITIFMHLIIFLIIGFGVGYWLLMKTSKYKGRIRTTKENIGVVFIALVIFLALFGFFYSMNINKSDYMPNIRQENTQKLYQEQNNNILENTPGAIKNP